MMVAARIDQVLIFLQFKKQKKWLACKGFEFIGN